MTTSLRLVDLDWLAAAIGWAPRRVVAAFGPDVPIHVRLDRAWLAPCVPGCRDNDAEPVWWAEQASCAEPTSGWFRVVGSLLGTASGLPSIGKLETLAQLDGAPLGAFVHPFPELDVWRAIAARDQNSPGAVANLQLRRATVVWPLLSIGWRNVFVTHESVRTTAKREGWVLRRVPVAGPGTTAPNAPPAVGESKTPGKHERSREADSTSAPPAAKPRGEVRPRPGIRGGSSDVASTPAAAPARLPEARPRIVRLPEVMHLTSLKRSQIYRLEKQGRFPKRFKLGQFSVAWHEADVDAWVRERGGTPEADS